MRRSSGRGLGQLLNKGGDSEIQMIALGDISTNKRQPRRHFDDDSLAELADSVKIHGILSPILVRPLSGGKYELIAGERRFRAAGIAGLAEVPAVVKVVAGQESLEIAIIENVQREDISAYEAALAYQQLANEFGLNQEEIALRVGKTRSAISNLLRLLRLPDKVLEELQKGTISEGHARALLGAESTKRQLEILAMILDRGISVRETESLAKESAKPPKKPGATREQKDVYTRQLETALGERFGLPTKIDRKGNEGVLSLTFYSDDDLQKILDALGVEL
ncbi:MAG TPA: ParB/RepB/Spo0J family partition protein [Fimbriimonas sp.]|nr:ParB/RepB/Spo0J family partition protein [Fimbriimonas sp.]